MTASATLSDGRIIDVTDEPALSWQSSDNAIASVSNQAGSEGMVTGINIGTVTLTATGENNGQTFIDSAELEVTPAIITELVIRAERQSIAAGFTTAMTATATLSDGTTRDVTHEPTLSWLSNEEDIASVSQDAIVTGKTSGTVVITAHGDIDGVSFHATESLTITEVIPVSLSVTPQPQANLATPQMPVGWSKAFYAHATLSDGNVIEVTQEAGLVWQSDNDAIASISNTDKGQAKGESVGQTTLHATLSFDTGSVSGSTIVTITPPHGITFDVRTDAFNNTVAGVRVHYIGYSPTAGYYVTTSGEGYLDSEMALIYLGGTQGERIDEHTFYFGQRSERPISGALTYQASFTWPDGSQTQGLLEWQFDSEHYELTDPRVAEHLLTREWDFTLTVSNEIPF